MIIIIWAWTNGQGLITRGVEQWRISNWTSFKTFGTARRNLKVNEIHDDQFCGVCKNTNTNINKNTDDRIKKQMKQMYRVIYVRPKITNIELKYPIIAGYKIETLFLSKVYDISQRGWNKSTTQSDLLFCEDWWSDCTSHKSVLAINPYFRRQQHVKPKLFRHNTVMSCCQNCHSYQNSDDDVVVHIHCQG